MEDLTYVCQWEMNKKKTWSGTCYSLRKELKKIYKIYDINLSDSLIIKILRKIGVLPKKNFYENNRITVRNTRGGVFQFSDNVNVPGCSIYIDLSSSYVWWLYKNNPKLFSVCGFQSQCEELLESRAKEQDKFFIEKAKNIFCMSKWLADWLKENTNIPKQKIVYIGAGFNINSKKIKLNIQKNRRRFLFIGRDFERKNGPLVIDAFQKLKEQMNDVELYVLGPNTNPIDNPTEGIYYIGEAKQKIVEKYYNLCDVFVMPSKFEAFGIVFPEALTFGLPCIGKNCFEMPNLIENGVTGELLSSDNPIELSELMKKILLNESYFENVKNNHNKYIKEYSWASVAKRISEHI